MTLRTKPGRSPHRQSIEAEEGTSLCGLLFVKDERDSPVTFLCPPHGAL